MLRGATIINVLLPLLNKHIGESPGAHPDILQGVRFLLRFPFRRSADQDSIYIFQRAYSRDQELYYYYNYFLLNYCAIYNSSVANIPLA